MKNSNNYWYPIRLFIVFAALMVAVPGLSNTGKIAFAGISVNNTSADTAVITYAGNLSYLSSPRLRNPATLRGKKSFKRFSIKRSRKIHGFRKKRFVNTHNSHHKELYALLGNAVDMKDLHFRLNALTPATPDWKAGLDSVLQPYIDGTEVYDSILVVGYTDNTGSKKTNLTLSAISAAKIKVHLIQQGIPENRIHILAMGEEAPVSSNKSVEGRNLNRRVEINFLKGS